MAQLRGHDVACTLPAGWDGRITVRNEGGETAAAVTVRGALLRGDSTLEESDASVDYVPIDGFRIGGVVFTFASATLVLVPLMNDPAVWEAMVSSLR